MIPRSTPRNPASRPRRENTAWSAGSAGSAEENDEGGQKGEWVTTGEAPFNLQFSICNLGSKHNCKLKIENCKLQIENQA
jgi:hypothetical protein